MSEIFTDGNMQDSYTDALDAVITPGLADNSANDSLPDALISQTPEKENPQPNQISNQTEQKQADNIQETITPAITPTPVLDNESKTPDEDSEHDTTTADDTTHAVGVADVYDLLTEKGTLLEAYQNSTLEYQESLLEKQDYLIEQSKNILSVSSLLLLAVGFLSGIFLARTVWRKL